MSPIFVRQIAKQFKCGNCKNNAAKGRKTCQTHLDYALGRYYIWKEQRNEQGLCWYCHRKQFKGWMRCKTHTMINRAKCVAWMAKQKALTLKTGLCKCKEHNPVKPGTLWCIKCAANKLEWQRAYRASK